MDFLFCLLSQINWERWVFIDNNKAKKEVLKVVVVVLLGFNFVATAATGPEDRYQGEFELINGKWTKTTNCVNLARATGEKKIRAMSGIWEFKFPGSATIEPGTWNWSSRPRWCSCWQYVWAVTVACRLERDMLKQLFSSRLVWTIENKFLTDRSIYFNNYDFLCLENIV